MVLFLCMVLEKCLNHSLGINSEFAIRIISFHLSSDIFLMADIIFIVTQQNLNSHQLTQWKFSNVFCRLRKYQLNIARRHNDSVSFVPTMSNHFSCILMDPDLDHCYLNVECAFFWQVSSKMWDKIGYLQSYTSLTVYLCLCVHLTSCLCQMYLFLMTSFSMKASPIYPGRSSTRMRIFCLSN